jgi:hypothetical protein
MQYRGRAVVPVRGGDESQGVPNSCCAQALGSSPCNMEHVAQLERSGWANSADSWSVSSSTHERFPLLRGKRSCASRARVAR